MKTGVIGFTDVVLVAEYVKDKHPVSVFVPKTGVDAKLRWNGKWCRDGQVLRI
ncbi:MAG: hypothetical protein DHS20C01_30650 [marine bacterium B5-7]|nr:MAG: hypothetical protein DHS20C01_30650 [marine bacterium B5-7]